MDTMEDVFFQSETTRRGLRMISIRKAVSNYGAEIKSSSISLALQNLKIYAQCLAMTRSTKMI